MLLCSMEAMTSRYQYHFPESFKNFYRSKKNLIIIRNGDHSLSSKKSLKKIVFGLDKIVKNIFLK